MVHVDNKGFIDGLRRNVMRCTGSRAQDADLWILIWGDLHRVEVEHVKAHRSKKDMQQMSLFEKFITEGNEKADELLAKEGARLDGGEKAQVTAITIQQERAEVKAAL